MGNSIKRFLALMLALVMVIGMMPTNVAFAEETEACEHGIVGECDQCNEAEQTPPSEDEEEPAPSEDEEESAPSEDEEESAPSEEEEDPDAGLDAAAEGGEETVAPTDVKVATLEELQKALAESTLPIVITETIVIPADQTAIIDLNGKTVTGNFHKDNGAVIKNEGTLTLKNGTVTSGANNGGSALMNKGTATVTGVTLNGAPNADGSWPSYTVNNTGTLEITGSKITSYHGAVASYGSDALVTLTETDIDMSGIPGFTSHALYTYDNGAVIVNSGNIANKAADQAASGASVINGAVTVNGGTFNGRVENYYGTPVIKGGTFKYGDNVVDVSRYVPEGYKYNAETGKVTSAYVAMIGTQGYKTLKAAVEAVEEGGIITLIANETFTKDNYSDNGGWKDGLYYVGDKSFTIDLGGFTIGQNGHLNDYLVNFKNVGSKANTITLKNGTLDAGTTAYCALCTSSSHENQLTINLENITLINNMSNGSTAKIRGGAILNVNSGTTINGKNSYLGIECVASTVNIYDGAKIYMDGTSSYNGCLVGACGGGTVNVYGGYGKGVKGGFIAMTSGGTINVSGGEWIANTDGTVGNNSNLYVLTAQSNKNESGFVGGAYINVTGGTFRGGMDAWVLNNLEGEVAELNISGGNFNANPANYLAEGYLVNENADGTFTVKAPVYAAKIGDTYYKTLAEAVASVKKGDPAATIEILADIKLTGPQFVGKSYVQNITIDLNGHEIYSTATVLTAYRKNSTLTVKNGTVTGFGGTLVSTYNGTLILGDDLNVRCGGGRGDALRIDNGTLIVPAETKNLSVIGTKADFALLNKYNISIAAGSFSDPIPAELCATGYAPAEFEDGTYGVQKMLVKSGNTYYKTLADAVAAAKTDGSTAQISLLGDVAGPGVVIDRNVNINFGGFTYTVTDPVGSAGTESNGFQILAGNTVTLRNGKINVAESAAKDMYILVQNYANLNLSVLHLDGTNLDKYAFTGGDSYVLSNNSGTVTYNGESSIIANNDGDKAFAFDVCKYANYPAPVVTVSTTVKVDGKIEAPARRNNTYYATLQQAIDASTTGTVVLVNDVTTSEIITIGGKVTLDGNKMVLNSTAARAINVSGAESVQIKNLTINCTGERAINVIGASKKLQVVGVTATAANYTVNVAASAPGADVTVRNSTLTGLNTVNVAAKGANVAISNSTVVCNDQNENESYAALMLNKDAEGATITATKVTFDVKGDSAKAVNQAPNGTIKIDGKVVEPTKVAAIIQYGNNYYHFETLADAIAYAKDGETITLMMDGETATAVAKAVTIEKNDFTANITAGEGFKVVETDTAYTIIEFSGVAEVNGEAYETLAEAIAAANAGDEVKLLENVTLADILVINKAITLNGDDMTLDSTAARAINVDTEDNVVIKNLTVTCTGERGINVINKPANLTIENVNVTAANYAVNVAASGAGAKIAIKDTKLAGLNTVNVAATNVEITIYGGKITSDDKLQFEGYGALTLNPVAEGSVITVRGVEIVVTGNSSVALNNTATGKIIFADGDYDVKRTVAYISYGDYQYTFSSLEDAIAKAQDGEIVTLICDIERATTLKIEKSVIIDGNGKTLTYTGSDRAIDVPSTATNVNLTIKNLTVNCTGSYCQRGINYNTNGALVLDSVTVKGTSVTYAVNMPSSSDGAKVTITNSDITGLIALNVWGENATVNVTGTALISVDNATHENYAAVKLNNNGTDSAEGTVINITGGSITALDENGDPSAATTNSTLTGKINISETVVTGTSEKVVAAVLYKGYTEFYGCFSLQDAVDKAADDPNATVKLLQNIEMNEVLTISGDVVIDFNGFTVTGIFADPTTLPQGNGVQPTVSPQFVLIEGGANVIMKDSTGNGGLYADTEEKCLNYLICVDKDSTLVIESGNYTMDYSVLGAGMIYTRGSDNLTVKGGNFHLGNVGKLSNGSPWIFNASGQNTRHIIVEGGTFNADILHQYYPFEVVVANNKALRNNGDGTYTMVDAVAYVTEKSGGYDREVGYATLEDAFAAAGNKYNVTLREGAAVTEIVILAEFTGKLYLPTCELTSIVNNSEKAEIVINGNVAVNNPNGSAITGEYITLTGEGNLTAIANGDHAYGIGGGETKSINIQNVHILEVKGGHVQPLFVNDTKYGKSEPEGGAAIGSGYNGAVITLTNVTIDNAQGGSKAAGIGASYHTGVTINITGCTIVNVEGGNASAGIGGSRVSNDASEQGTTINILNSTITAKGGQAGAGIGSGYDTHCQAQQPLCTISIEGSTINATGGKYAAGVGTGYHNAALAGVIKSSTVKAVSGDKFYKDGYTQAQDIGFGVVDPAREGVQLATSYLHFEVADTEGLKAALENGATNVVLTEGTYTFPTSSLKEGVTLECEEGTVFEGNSKLNINGATVVGATFSNPTGTAADQTINGTFKNCTFTGSNALRWCYAGDTVVFENCTFSGDVYGVHFDGGANKVVFKNCTFSGFNAMAGSIELATFEGCTFESNGKSDYNGINLWGSAEMTDCTFVFDGSATYEWIDLCGENKTVTFNNCKVVNGDETASVATVATKRHESGKIFVDGYEIVADGVAKDQNGDYYISNANGLKWVATEVNKVAEFETNSLDGKTVKLMNDIDLGGAEWEPIGNFGNSSKQFTGIFDGQDHVISNFKITQKTPDRPGKDRSPHGFFGNVNGTIKNLTLENATLDVQNAKWAGALVGRLNGGAIENCHVIDSSVTIYHWQVGGLLGQLNNGKISDCSVVNTTVNGYAQVGAIVGVVLTAGERVIENCAVKDTKIVQNGSFGGNYDKMFGSIVGALYSGKLTVNINGCKVENTTVLGKDAVAVCGYVSDGDKLFVDGYEYICDGLLKKGAEYIVYSADGLATLNTMMANKTAGRDAIVNLVADIDFSGKNWTPVDSNADSAFEIAELNGNGHTISNMTINGQAMFTRFAGSGDVVIKDITFDNATVNSTALNTAILTVQTYQNVLLDNVDVKNSSITGSYKVAPLIATVYNEGSSTVTATLKNCDVSDTTVHGNLDFMVAGMVAFVYESDNDKVVFENCTVSNVTLSSNSKGYGAMAAVYCNNGNAEGSFDEVTGVTVTNVTKN